MYEHLRNDMVAELGKYYNPQEILKICSILDKVSYNYDVKEKETALIVYEGECPRLVETYFQSKRLEGFAAGSEKLYRNRLRIFFEYVQKSPEQITINDIRCFLDLYKRQRNVKDRTLDKFRQIISSFFEWCVNEDYLDKNPCKNIKKIKWVAEPRKALKRKELETLRRACKNKRELAIVDTLYSTGCRVSELANMKISEIDVPDTSIHIIGKGNKHHTCYFNTNAQVSIDEYMDERISKGIDSDYLFVRSKRPYTKLSAHAVEDIFKTLKSRTGLKVTPHTMRHTTATLMYSSGASLTQIQKTLNHANPSTTMIYTEISKEDIKQAHDKFVV